MCIRDRFCDTRPFGCIVYIHIQWKPVAQTMNKAVTVSYTHLPWSFPWHVHTPKELQDGRYHSFRYFHHKSFYYEVKDESDFFYLILCRLCLLYTSITIVGPINATRPVMVLVGAMLVFGERLNLYQWIGVMLALSLIHI